MPTGSRSCPSAKKRSSGISIRQRWPAATSSMTSATRTTCRCGRCSRRCWCMVTRLTRPCLAAIRRYTKLFWINTGPFNNLTARKFLLPITREQLIGGGTIGRRGRRRAAPALRGIDRGSRRAACAGVLRPRRRRHGHEQDARTGPRHPRIQRQQPLRRRDDERSGGVPRSASV